MIKRVFYNSSFPRSGSTLLQNVLGQNPDIFPSATSGMFTMLLETRRIFTHQILFQAQNQKELLPGFEAFLKGGLYSYYGGLTDKPYAIDKFRGWVSEYDFLNSFDKKPKVVCMVRDARSIFTSFEKKYRQNPLKDHEITDYYYPTGNSTITRIQTLMGAPVMSLPMDGLWQMILQKQDTNIHFIKYEELCKFPMETMEELYQYLEIPYYEHNFDVINQITHENDQLYPSFGDHIIKNKLQTNEADYIETLGVDACNFIVERYKWFYDYFNYKI